jgi:hypothetical protein
MHRALDAVIDNAAAKDKYPKTDRQKPAVCEVCGQRTRIFTNLNGPDVYDWHNNAAGKTCKAGGKRPGKVTAARAWDGFTARASKEAAMQSLGGFATQYEVRKSRSNDAWAVFKIGDDFPVTSWTNSKAAAMIDARRLNGGVAKARPKSQESAALEVAKRTELNPVVRNYFKLDDR